jgi:hypothetical protein
MRASAQGADFRIRKKNPGSGPGLQAFLLSHIKAPAQGGKAGSGEPPGRNLTNRPRAGKRSPCVFLLLPGHVIYVIYAISLFRPAIRTIA